MNDAFEFNPAAIDGAIARLNAVLDLVDQRKAEVEELQHVTLPGAAPSTRGFHTLLGRSMTRLREQHETFRLRVENQIEELKKTRDTYTATDDAQVRKLGRIT